MSQIDQAHPNQIALIGVTQSGKTTLAAGLAKSSDDDFTVGFADDTTREYLGKVISLIDGEKWPPGNGGENIDLAITLNTKGGHSTSIVFKEYKGEKFTDPTYLQKIVGSPNGALILLNPGMEMLQSPVGRSKMLINMKRIIDHLKSVSCTAIALVVTAHDRLSTDLKDQAQEFYEHLSEVENYLGTSQITWRRFEVTITGRLSDQNAPAFAKGAENTARAPFVWLMDRIEAQRRHLRLMKLFKGAALAAAVLAVATGLGLSWELWQEWESLAEQKANAQTIIGSFEFEDAQKSTGSESGMKKATDELHRAISSLETNTYWFSFVDSRRVRHVDELRPKYDELRSRYLHKKIDKCQGKTDGLNEDECRGVDQLIVAFTSTNTLLKSALTNSWAKVRPEVRRKSDSKQERTFGGAIDDAKDDKELGKIYDDISRWEVTRDFAATRTNLLMSVNRKRDKLKGDELGDMLAKQDSIKEHTRQEVDDLGKWIGGWSPYTDYGKKVKTGLQEDFAKKSKVWYQEITDRACNDAADAVCQKLGTVELDDSTVIRKALTEAVAVAQAHTNATRTVWQDATNRICRAQDSFLERFRKKYTDKWTPEAKKRPALLSKEDEDFITEALDVPDDRQPGQKLSVKFLDDLKEGLKKADDAWLEHQKKEVDKFIETHFSRYMSVTGLIDDYRQWWQKMPDSPCIAIADQRVLEVVGGFFDDYIKEVDDFTKGDDTVLSDDSRKRICERFAEFKKICCALKKDPCGLTNTWCASFAKECVLNGGVATKNINDAFLLTLTITRIDAVVSDSTRDHDYNGVRFKVGFGRQEWEGQDLITSTAGFPMLSGYDMNNCQEQWCTLLEGANYQVSLNPWTKSFLLVTTEVDISLAGTPTNTVAIWLRRRKEDYRDGESKWDWQFERDPPHVTGGGYRVSLATFRRFDCSFKIYFTIDGPDLFELYKKCRYGGSTR